MTLGQESEVYTRWRLAIKPLLVRRSEVDGTPERADPVWPDGIEVGVRNDDEVYSTKFVDLRAECTSVVQEE